MDDVQALDNPGVAAGTDQAAEQYRLTVRGHLGAQAAEWFEGLTVTNRPDGTTEIAAPLADQAALYALLTRIQSLGLPLLAVNRGPPASPRPPAQNTKRT